MEKNLEPYVKITNENVKFEGDTPTEKKLNEWLYNITLELNRYQDMTQEILNYILSANLSVKEVQDIYKIIKNWNC